MLALAKLYRKIFRRRGQTAVEYAMIIAGVSFVMYNTFKGGIDEKFKKGVEELGKDMQDVLETGRDRP